VFADPYARVRGLPDVHRVGAATDAVDQVQEACGGGSGFAGWLAQSYTVELQNIYTQNMYTVETHSLDGDGSFLANRGLETIKTVRD
jgi:hypothetical protein